MKIVFLTPGTGSYYCGACMRDNALARSLLAAGHEAVLLPMYLPLQLDEEVVDRKEPAPVFFGGINVWLQQKCALFRHTPAWFDGWLNRPAMLRYVARHSHMTSAREHGEMTLAMLRVEESRFCKELEKLVRWLEGEMPAVVCLSTALQAGMIRELKRRLGAKVICHFQGEDGFLDSLPPPWREACWSEMATRVRESDVLVAPSGFYADYMRERLGPARLDIEVIPNGIELEGYEPLLDKPAPPVIGFFARMIRDKGIEVMVDAFVHLRRVLGHADARLHLAGTVAAGDQPVVDALKRKLAQAGLDGEVEWSPNVSRGEKARILRSLTLFSVPTIYQEAFGLYVVEAMACGVPVVQPDAASFREIIGGSGGGLLVPPGDAVALARAWHDLLGDGEARREMGARARRAAEESHAVEVMRDRFLVLAGRLAAGDGG